MSHDSHQKKPWAKPDFQEIALNMEVTAYVNTGDEMPSDPVDITPATNVTDSASGPRRESDS